MKRLELISAHRRQARILPVGPPTPVRGDIQVSTIESKSVIRRNENPTLIIEPVILLPTVAAVTLEDIPSKEILVEQVQREDASNHPSGASAKEI